MSLAEKTAGAQSREDWRNHREAKSRGTVTGYPECWQGLAQTARVPCARPAQGTSHVTD